LPFTAPERWVEAGGSNVFDLAVFAAGSWLLAERRTGGAREIVQLLRTPAKNALVSTVVADASEPWLSADAQRLYFMRDEGSLWMVPWQSAGVGAAREVFGSGAFGSSARGRGGPVLTQDELAVYYSEPYDGQTDIYLASRPSTQGSFNYAGAFGFINSQTEDETPDWLSPDGCRLYFERRTAAGRVQILMASK
jgi:hypothetical protein